MPSSDWVTLLSCWSSGYLDHSDIGAGYFGESVIYKKNMILFSIDGWDRNTFTSWMLIIMIWMACIFSHSHIDKSEFLLQNLYDYFGYYDYWISLFGSSLWSGKSDVYTSVWHNYFSSGSGLWLCIEDLAYILRSGLSWILFCNSYLEVADICCCSIDLCAYSDNMDLVQCVLESLRCPLVQCNRVWFSWLQGCTGSLWISCAMILTSFDLMGNLFLLLMILEIGHRCDDFEYMVCLKTPRVFGKDWVG
ncbi:hypothetical protein Tco_1159481 [Tanacetum coccineum]